MKHIILTLPLATAAFSSRTLISRAFARASISSTRNRFEPSLLLKPHRTARDTRRQQSMLSSSRESAKQDGKGVKDDDDKIKILGMCGGIGSGKSTACQLMVDSLGCMALIDADKLAHVVYEPGSKALVEIAEEFGKEILDDSDNAQIDRKKLGAIVFSDAESMSKLEQIVWPHVLEKIEERIEEIKNEHKLTACALKKIIIVEAALLLETNWHNLLDGLWVVQSSSSVAVQRLKDNRGLTKEEALVRIRAQETRRGIGSFVGGDDTTSGSLSGKLQEEMNQGLVTAVITNDGTLPELRSSLEKALEDPASFKR